VTDIVCEKNNVRLYKENHYDSKNRPSVAWLQICVS